MGKLVAFCQWRPTEGIEKVCVCERRLNLMRSKTNGGKDRVKEQEELRVQGENKYPKTEDGVDYTGKSAQDGEKTKDSREMPKMRLHTLSTRER